MDRYDEEWDAWAREQEAAAVEKTEKAERIPEDWMPYIQNGETRWTIEHNAASAGFLDVPDYLRWRENNKNRK
jgi:flavodoxin